MLSYGFIDLFGVAWTNPEVDRYNKIQKEIEQRKADGFEIPDQLLNDAHRIFLEPKRTRDLSG